MATFDCSVLRRAPTPSAVHRSSTSRSARTSSPASRARRTTSSDVLPPGTGTRWPSRLTSRAPSTATESTSRGYSGPRQEVSRRRQRIVSAGAHSEPMPTDIEVLLHRLIGGDDTAPAEILDRAQANDTPGLLVAAALVADQPG